MATAQRIARHSSVTPGGPKKEGKYTPLETHQPPVAHVPCDESWWSPMHFTFFILNCRTAVASTEMHPTGGTTDKRQTAAPSGTPQGGRRSSVCVCAYEFAFYNCHTQHKRNVLNYAMRFAFRAMCPRSNKQTQLVRPVVLRLHARVFGECWRTA